MRHACHHAEIMRDQQHAHAALALDLRQQVEHLSLDGHVERRGRLICNQQLRPASERHRDHHTLLHAAGKLEGIVSQPPRRVGNADCLEQAAGFDFCLGATDALPRQGFGNLCAHGHHRVQTGCRLLEDHADAPAAHAAHGRLRQAQQILAPQPDLTTFDAPTIGKQTCERECSHRLATARLTKQSEGLTGGNGQVNAVDRTQLSVTTIKDDPETRNGQQRDGRRQGLDGNAHGGISWVHGCKALSGFAERRQ